MKEQYKKSLIDYFEVIIKRRWFIARNVVVITIVSIIITFLIPEQFTATVTILPPSTDQQSMLSMMSTVMGGDLSRLVSMGGGLQGLTTLSDLFAAIMKSGNIRGRVIEKYNLKRVFGVKKNVDALEKLDDITRITISPEGIIGVSVTYHDKYLTSNIANSFVEELDRFNTETAMTMGKKYRIFVEKQLKETKDSLLMSEEALRDFQSKHKTIALQEEIQSAIEGVAQLKSQIIALEVRRNVLKSSAQLTNPNLQNISRELHELKKQLTEIEFGANNKKEGFGAGFSMAFSELPELSLEYARLLRDAKIQAAVYEILVQQHEQAKIMEAKDTPTVQIIDSAGPPEKKSFPKRKKIAFLVFLSSLFGNIGLVLLLERFQKAKVNKDAEIMRWSAVFNQLKMDFLSLLKFKSKFLK